MMGDDGEKEVDMRRTIGEHWLWMSKRWDPMKISPKPFTPFFRVHIASLCNLMLSHCYLLLWRSEWERKTRKMKKKCFIHRIFIKHQPHDHLLYVSHLIPIARVKKNDERRWIIDKWNHLHLMILLFCLFFFFFARSPYRHTPQEHSTSFSFFVV